MKKQYYTLVLSLFTERDFNEQGILKAIFA